MKLLNILDMNGDTIYIAIDKIISIEYVDDNHCRIFCGQYLFSAAESVNSIVSRMKTL